MKRTINKNTVLSVLSSFRFLFDDVGSCPDILLEDLKKSVGSSFLMYPCDLIELRTILEQEKIKGIEYVPLFSFNFSEKYLKEYAIFLNINSSLIKAGNLSYGGLKLYKTNEINIEDRIRRVIVNDVSLFKEVSSLLKEVGITAECIVSNSVPGISYDVSKLSISGDNIKKSQKTRGSELPLTPKENNIFEFLRQVKKDMNLNIQMRVAGGWVRDKLLGKESDDIDIAVDMPGYELARIISEAAVRYNINHVDRAYRVSLEKSNTPVETPSDDLMVGAVNLFGQKIEFVPMRTEHYPDPNSRTPRITTTSDPKEDVKRRDLTINALYYNVDTGQVEDFVGGKEDLGLGGGQIQLRTPDEAHKTFEEDPLRLLRVLRFHSRYPNSIVDPSIIEAMKDPDIHESYKRKVATERAGPEIVKMMMGDNPVSAIKFLFETDLYKTVFAVPSMETINPEGKPEMDQQTPHHKYNLMNHILKVIENLNTALKSKNVDNKTRGLMNLSAFFHDFGKMQEGVQQPHPNQEGRMTYHGHEDKSTDMINEILSSISATKEEKDFVQAIVGTHMYPHKTEEWMKRDFKGKVHSGPGDFIEKLKVRGKKDLMSLWEYVFDHAEADAKATSLDKYDEEKFNRGKEWFSQYYNLPRIEYTRNKGSIINGLQIDGLRQGLEKELGVKIRKDIIRDTLGKIIEMQYAGTMQLGEEEKALQVAKNWMKSKVNDYIDNSGGPTTMGSNWFKKIKKSQVLSGVGGNVEVNKIDYKDEGIVTGLKPAKCPYKPGMKVRDRRKGLALPQEYGRVKYVNDNEITIQWYDSNDKKLNKQKFKIDDTVALSAIVAEV